MTNITNKTNELHAPSLGQAFKECDMVKLLVQVPNPHTKLGQWFNGSTQEQTMKNNKRKSNMRNNKK